MLVYLDNSATTRQYDKVTEEMINLMKEDYGNPSSLHEMGILAEKRLKESRKILAKSLNAETSEVFFTSGGTEADNTVLFGVSQGRKRSGNKIITTTVEHPAILEPCKRLEEQGFNVVYLDVDKKCNINLEQLKAELDNETILISTMAVNNEVGTILPINEINKIKLEYNKTNNRDVLLHTDGVQGYGKIDFKDIHADLISLSSHKIHGPKGMGGLMVRKGLNVKPYLIGGGQEGGFRSGTENMPAICGFAKAIEHMEKDFEKRTSAMAKARKHLLDGLKLELDDLMINSIENVADGCAPSVLNISFLGTRGEVLLHTLEQDGIYVSTGSACASNHKGQSHVLKAMGLKPKEIEGAIRFSFNEFNTVEEMDYVIEKTKIAVNRFRKLGSFR